MSKGFRIRVLNIYSNFMKFTFQNTLLNLILTLIENMPLLFVIDLMFNSDILSSVFTPLYYLSPNVYLDLLNEKLTNDCNEVLPNFNNYILNQTTATDNSFNINNYNITDTNNKSGLITILPRNNITLQFKFFNNLLINFDKQYCIYSIDLIYTSVALILTSILLFVILAYMNPRKDKSSNLKSIFSFLMTNFCNLMIRPFGVLLLIVLFNKPILMLYKNEEIAPELFSREIINTFISVLFIIIFIILSSNYIKYINNCYFFEKFPYDYYSKSDGLLLLVLKIFIALKINFEKLNGMKHVFFVNLILGILISVRFIMTLTNRKSIINSLSIKHLGNFISTFLMMMIILKIINQSLIDIYQNTILTLFLELFLILFTVIYMQNKVFQLRSEFTFNSKENFIEDTMNFMYYIGELNKNNRFEPVTKFNNTHTDSFIDNIIIGHKMKCRLDLCILCAEDIYNPDLTTLMMILYQQFLRFQKDMREQNEEITISLRLIFLKMLDEKKIHRISFVVLKNTKLELPAYLKIFYLYNDLLDEINVDLKNLLTIKYGEIYDELLQVISKFEDILGSIKSRTEKIEPVINKINQIGEMFKKLRKDAHFLKRNKRIFYDSSNMMQIICIIRLLFQRNVDIELADSLENNFSEFLDGIDKIFAENRSFLIQYDFSNNIWRIKKVPKIFIDMTKMKISDLIDQSIEKVFPYKLGKNIVKRLEDLILSNIIDSKIVFKAFVCDSQTNLKYVKLDIDIVPNLDKNYILLMYCHFHKRNLLIVDEFGNFVNGSEYLYEKMNINSEMVAASKGKINMYNVFNLPKTTKIDEVKIVSISDQGLADATRKVFLLESDYNITTIPPFLNEFVKSEKAIPSEKKNYVYMNLFDTIPIDDMNYYVFTIKLSGDNNNNKDETQANGNPNSNKKEIKDKDKEESSNSSIVLENNTRNIKKNYDLNGSNSHTPQENLHTYQNCLDYYNYFYDTHKSASVTMDNNNYNLNSNSSSNNNSANSDIYSFLYIRSASSNRRSNKFENFLFGIYIFNFFLVIMGLVSIIYFAISAKVFRNYIDNYFLFNTFRSGVFTTTWNFFPLLSVDQNMNFNNTDKNIYNNYVAEFISNENKNNSFRNFDLDYYLKINSDYHSEYIMNEITEFFNSAYNFYGPNIFDTNINYKTNFMFFNSIGNYNIREEFLKDLFGLYSLASNQFMISNSGKTFLNISFYNFQNGKLVDINKNLITNEDNNYFQSKVNIYQYFFNYFSVFYKNLNMINNLIVEFGKNYVQNIQTNSRALLFVLVILNILFILISFFSILIYKRILRKEFSTLYSLNEEQINKLKEKFTYVRELIKLEHFPSKIYYQLRKMKEVEAKQFVDKKKTLNSSKISYDSKSENLNIEQSYLHFAGGNNDLFRSNSIKVKKKIEKIKKEKNQSQASIMLLKRLSLKFELINKFIYFILLMSLFYLVMGILITFLLTARFNSLNISMQYVDLFIQKHTYFYNYYIGVKLSVFFDKLSPYTFPNEVYNENCVNCNFDLLTQFNNVTDQLDNLESTYSFLNDILLNDQGYRGSDLCVSLITNPNDLISYLKANSTYGEGVAQDLLDLCKGIPILQTNVESVLTSIIINIREIYDNFIMNSDKTVNTRIQLLQNDFRFVDILIGIFAEPYFCYIKGKLLVDQLYSSLSNYSSFLIAIFSINILIDFIILLYIRIKIYKKLITSVNNLHLITDSVMDV